MSNHAAVTDTDLDLLREGYRMWHESKAGSVEYWLNLLADDVIWRSIADGEPGMEFTRERHGRDAVAEYFRESHESWEMRHFTIDEIIHENDRYVAIGHCGWRHRETGKTVETPKADVIRMRDGKIVEFFDFYDTAKAFAAAE